MNPDHTLRPPVTAPQEPCRSEANSRMWDVTIYHPDRRAETRQVDFAEMVQIAARDNLKFTEAPAG